ncbi:hypothetical protein Dimus_009623 [Dionaea muscipula]
MKLLLHFREGGEKKTRQRKTMKNCELCISPARIYCDSDQASLCWDCDSKIHGANFLVTRHSRTLLCHVCQSPTPWSASGAKLAPTVSVCEACVVAGYKPDNAGSLFHEGGGGSSEDEIRGGEELEIGSEEEDGDDSDYDEDEGGNQVVPWSPPPAITSLNSEESSNEDRDAPFPILLDRAPEGCSDLAFQYGGSDCGYQSWK